MSNVVDVGMLVIIASFQGAGVVDGRAVAWVDFDSNGSMEEGWRRHSETGFRSAYLDINGDGVRDQATMVVSSDDARAAIRICFGSEVLNTLGDCRIIAEGENFSSAMGLEVRSAGCYEFYEDDLLSRADGPVCSRRDVLEYFRFGSSGSFFIYDENLEVFRRYWDSL